MSGSAFVILMEVLLSIILVIIVLGNLFVIEAVCRHVRLRTIPNICITSLAIADLFVGLINVPMYMYAIYHDDAFEQRYSKEYTLALNSLDMYFGAASILHLAFISTERCYAISFPLRRRFLQKGKRVDRPFKISRIYMLCFFIIKLLLIEYGLTNNTKTIIPPGEKYT